MSQLLSITSTPIKIEVNVTGPEYKARENTNKAPAVKISRSNAGVKIAAQPYQIDISTSKNYDAYVPNTFAQNDTNGVTISYDALAKIAGDDTTNTSNKVCNPQYATQKASRSIESILSKLPKTKTSNISYNEGTLRINYSLENSLDTDSFEPLDFSSGFEFIPGSIEFIVSQMPELEIEYLGEPIYFPRSADPNYVGEVDIIV